MGGAHKGRVGVLEQGDVGDRQGADGFAVVAAGQAEEFGFLRPAAVAPEMEAHFQRNFSGRSAIRGIKRVSQRACGQRG